MTNYIDIEEQELLNINGGFTWVPVLKVVGTLAIAAVAAYCGHKDGYKNGQKQAENEARK